jgi:hypothetical protein
VTHSNDPVVLRNRPQVVVMSIVAVLFVGGGIAAAVLVANTSAVLGGALLVGYGLWTAYEAWASGVRPRASALAVHMPYRRTQLVPGPGRVEVMTRAASSDRFALRPVVVFDDGRPPVDIEVLGRTPKRGAEQAQRDQAVLQRWLDAT